MLVKICILKYFIHIILCQCIWYQFLCTIILTEHCLGLTIPSCSDIYYLECCWQAETIDPVYACACIHILYATCDHLIKRMMHICMWMCQGVVLVRRYMAHMICFWSNQFRWATFHYHLNSVQSSACKKECNKRYTAMIDGDDGILALNTMPTYV